MSNVSNVHDVVVYDAKATKPFQGQRLAKVLYKTPKDGSVKPDNKAVSIPVINDLAASELERLKPFIVAMVQDTQDAIVKELVETGATQVQDEQITVDCCIAWLATEAQGNRLTKEYIVEWFVDTLQDLLTVAIADKLGVGDTPSDADTVKVEQMVSAYKGSFAMLAGGKTSFPPAKADKMLKVLELVEGDALAGKFVSKLQAMKVSQSVDLMGL